MCFHCSCSCRQCTFPPKEFSYKIFKAAHHSFLNVFFVAHFILTTLSYGVPAPCRSTGMDYLVNLSYYSRNLSGNTSVFLSHHTAGGLWTCLWRWRMFCSHRIALVLLLLSFAAVRSQGYEMCFNCGSAQQQVSSDVDSTGADAFCTDVSCTPSYLMNFVLRFQCRYCIWGSRVCSGCYYIYCYVANSQWG